MKTQKNSLRSRVVPKQDVQKSNTAPGRPVAETMARSGRLRSPAAKGTVALTTVQLEGGNGQPIESAHKTIEIVHLGDDGNPDPDYFFTVYGGFIVARAARLIQSRGHVCVGTDGRLYRYEGGVYRSDGEAIARIQTRE